MNLYEIIPVLEAAAPLPFQESYDNSGLLTGDPNMEITGVLIALDITRAVMDEAAATGCNLIISHHPMLFRPLKKLTGTSLDQQLILRAVRENLAVYTMHTNIDNAFNGLNRFVAGKLGLSDGRILRSREDFLAKLVSFCPGDHADSVKQALFAAGAGHIGNYDQCSFSAPGTGSFRALDNANPYVGGKNVLHHEPEHRIEVIFPVHLQEQIISALLVAHPYEEVAYDIYSLKNRWNGMGSGWIGELKDPLSEAEFMAVVQSVTGIPVIRHTAFNGNPVRTVALCTGSGSFLIPDALRAGADVFLTADLKYHDFFDHSGSILLADIGHYESEYHVKELIASFLIEKFPTFAILISNIGTNPVNYYK